MISGDAHGYEHMYNPGLNCDEVTWRTESKLNSFSSYVARSDRARARRHLWSKTRGTAISMRWENFTPKAPCGRYDSRLEWKFQLTARVDVSTDASGRSFDLRLQW